MFKTPVNSIIQVGCFGTCNVNERILSYWFYRICWQ